jgi:hypothetical protein
MAMAENSVSDVTIAEQVACVDRELAMRGRVYPRWVKAGKLTQAAADTEIKRMEAVRASLVRVSQELRDVEAGTLFTGEVYGPAKVRADERAIILNALRPMVHTDVLLRIEAKLAKGVLGGLSAKEVRLAALHLEQERKGAVDAGGSSG